MKALDRKLWRDLQRMGGQALTIAAVMAVGIVAVLGMCAVAAIGSVRAVLKLEAAEVFQ